MSNYASDNFDVGWNMALTGLIDDFEQSFQLITKWLRDLGIKVNEAELDSNNNL